MAIRPIPMLHGKLHDLQGSLGSHGFGVGPDTAFGPAMDCATATLLGVQARLYMLPIYLPRTCDIFGLACSVTVVGTAGAIARLGIYRGDMTPTPFSGFLGLPDGAPLLDVTVTTTALGFRNAFAPGNSLVLSEGVYYLALAPQGAPATQATFRASSGHNPIMAGNTELGGAIAGKRSDGHAGALPTFPGATATQLSPAPVCQLDVNQWL